MAHKEPEIIVLPPDTEKIKRLWRVALILGLVTAVEFVIAFTLPHGAAKTFLFVILTIVKAGYIVGEFMHLRYEVKVLFWAVLIPMIFVVWMLVAFVYEGTKIVTY
jgi:cytochrome c oxidase subunit IV